MFQPRAWGAAFSFLACALLAAVLAAVLVNRDRSRSDGLARPARPKEQLPQARREVYPYPECAACVQWLRDNAGEPDSLQFFAWRRALPIDGEGVVITVKYRTKTQFGGWAVEKRNFGVANGKVIFSSPDLRDD